MAWRILVKNLKLDSGCAGCLSKLDLNKKYMGLFFFFFVVSRGAVRSVASSYAAMRKVAGSRPVLVIA